MAAVPAAAAAAPAAISAVDIRSGSPLNSSLGSSAPPSSSSGGGDSISASGDGLCSFGSG